MLQKAYSHWRGILMSYIRQFCIIVKSSLSGVRLLAETLALIFNAIWHGLIIKSLSLNFFRWCMCMHAQLCPTPCYSMDYIQPFSFVHGIFQARILEWVVISFVRGSYWPRDQTCISCVSSTEADFLPPRHLESLIIW